MPERGTQYFLGSSLIEASFLNNSPILLNSFEASLNDADAEAFINAAGITGSAATAVNTLVVDLKTNNYWDQLTAIYPMVGANAASHKYNLKNPQDTNAAYRLNFVGGWTHNSSGAKPDGVSGTYADTFLQASTVFRAGNGTGSDLPSGSLSYYSFTNNAAADDVEIGATGAGASGESLIALRFSDGNQYVFFGQAGGSSASTASNGFIVASIGQAGGAQLQAFKNGTSFLDISAGSSVITTNTIYLGAENNGTTGYRNSTRGCSFASIGSKLSNLGTFSTIVNNFQTSLGRNQY